MSMGRRLGESVNLETYTPNAYAAERNMLAALLARAICDAFGTIAIERKDKRQAHFWLMKSQSRKSFSFYWVCQHINIDPKTIRDSLLKDSSGIVLKLHLNKEYGGEFGVKTQKRKLARAKSNRLSI